MTEQMTNASLHPLQSVQWLTRRQTWVLLSILVLAVVLYWWKFDAFQVGIYRDDAEYIVLAKSIIVGPEYGLINEPGGVRPTRYPFGWPLILAPVYALFDGNFQALKAVSFFATLANITIIALAWKWLGLGFAWIGLTTAGLYAFLSLTVGHAGMVMSEAAFLTIVLVSLALSTYLSHTPRQKLLLSLLLGTLWMLAVYVRTIGITVIVACIIYLVWHSRWRTVGISLLGLVISLALIIISTPISFSDVVDVSAYQSQLENPEEWASSGVENDIVARSLDNVENYLRWHVRDTLIPFVGDPSAHSILLRLGLGWLPDVVSVGVVGLIIAGYILTFRSNFHPSHLFVLAYLLILIVWPWRGERFLYGVVPYLIAYTLFASVTLLDWLTTRPNHFFRHNKQWFYRIGSTILILWFSAVLMRIGFIGQSTDYTPDLRVGTIWIGGNTPGDALIITEQPLVTHLYAQRSTISPNLILEEPMGLSCTLPTFILVSPEIKWRRDGQLALSSTGLVLEERIKQNQIEATIIFHDTDAKVIVARLSCSSQEN